MKITDCHCHLGGNEQPRRVLEWMKAVGTDRLFLFSACANGAGSKARDYVEHAARLGREGGDRIAPFAWLDPTWRGSVKLLHDAVEKLGIRGVKIIPDRWYPWDRRCVQLYRHIEQLNVPILFHSGILWHFGDTSRYCRPAEYEVLMEFPGVRFALAHIGWPWVDECLAVAGKIRAVRRRRGLEGVQCYVDLTPGAPEAWRRDALKKTLNYISDEAILFGTDAKPPNGADWARRIVRRDTALLRSLRAPARVRHRIFWDNAEAFLNG